MFKRPLSKLEIQAIAHQRTSSSHVKVGEYFWQERHKAVDSTKKSKNPSVANHNGEILFNLIHL